MTSFRDRFKEYQLQWLAWVIVMLLTLAISLFFGVNYPIPDQPEQPPEPVELGAHFANPIDITGSSSASAPALTFQGDTDTGLFRSAADTFNIAAGGTEYLELDSTSVTFATDLDFDAPIDLDGSADEVQLSVTGYTTQTNDLVQLDGGLTDIGGGSYSIADGDNDLGVAADLEVGDQLDVTGATTLHDDVTLANDKTIYPSTHATGTHGITLVCSGSHDHSSAENVVKVCDIPANANVVDFGYHIATDWNDGTSATVNCGIDGGASTDVDAFLAAQDINAVGDDTYVRMGASATSPASTALGDIGAQDAYVRCQVAEGDNDASAGSATFYLWYQLD
jgi:hypothetical protein